MPDFPLSWTALFVLISYLMGLACLYRCFRVGSREGWWRGLREVGIFVLFCGLAYGVESWAHSRTPYYYYSVAFPDRIARLPVERLPFHRPPPPTRCGDYVLERGHDLLGDRPIPISVPIFEGALAFAALWTARFLRAPVLLRPFLAGMVLVNVDLLLDPIVANTYDCDGRLLRRGLGFWNWHLDERYIADFYGIPLFNFAGWFGAAVLLVALAHLLGWGTDAARWVAPKVSRRFTPAPFPPVGKILLMATMVGAVGFVLWISPSKEPPLSPPQQWLLLGAVIVGTGLLVLACAGSFRTRETAAPDLSRTLALPLGFSLFALLASGQFIGSPSFLYPALLAVAVGALLCWWPYEEVVCRFGQRLIDLDRFIRLHYVGYPWLLVLLGAAFATAGPPRAATVGGLLIVALCFHVYSCVLNDVLDLEIDRTQVRRQKDPLVRGAIERGTAHAFALLQLPIIALLTHLLSPGWAPLGLMAAACLLMGAYNRWGKRCPLPPLTDAVQGAAWGTLALYGAWMAGGISPMAWAVFAYGAGFMTLINGIHGGLRDLSNDLRCQRHNTARLLGAEADPHDPYRVRSTWRVVAFAFIIQTAMLGLLAWILYRDALPYHVPLIGGVLPRHDLAYPLARLLVIGAFAAVAAWCHVLLWRLVRPGWRTDRDHAGSMHAFFILLAALVVLTPALGRALQVIVPLSFFLPLLVQYVEPLLGRVFPALRGRVGDVPRAR